MIIHLSFYGNRFQMIFNAQLLQKLHRKMTIFLCMYCIFEYKMSFWWSWQVVWTLYTLLWTSSLSDWMWLHNTSFHCTLPFRPHLFIRAHILLLTENGAYVSTPLTWSLQLRHAHSRSEMKFLGVFLPEHCWWNHMSALTCLLDNSALKLAEADDYCTLKHTTFPIAHGGSK